MAESKPSKKNSDLPIEPVRKKADVNPRWLVPTMLGLMLLGLAWIITYYLTSAHMRLPIPTLGNWNLAVGFALIIAGFGLTTRWK